MMTFKQRFMRLVCAVEICGLIWLLCFGSQGLRALMRLNTKLNESKAILAKTESELAALESEYDQWQHNSFFVEKYAREKLAMSRPDEIIGVVKKRV